MRLENSEGETSGEDFCDGDYSDIDDYSCNLFNHTECSISGEHTGQRWHIKGKQSSKFYTLHNIYILF